MKFLERIWDAAISTIIPAIFVGIAVGVTISVAVLIYRALT